MQKETLNLMGANTISIKEITRKYGVSPSTINHYTNIGLLSVAERKKNSRFYLEAEVKAKLRRIAQLRGKGYPLHLIQKELNKG